MSKLEEESGEEVEDIEFTELGSKPLTDETITQEQINEMKMLGMDKPELVSWERWQRIQNIRSEHRHMIHMAAAGIPQGRIAAELGYEEATVSKVLNTPEVKEAVNKEIQEIYGQDHKKALKDRALKAIGVVDDILTNGKQAEAASMAKWVIEHSVGKAAQEVNVQHTTLTEVRMLIGKMEQETKLRDVGSNSQLLPKEEDPFDTVINQIIPQGMVIGKRGGNSEGQS